MGEGDAGGGEEHVEPGRVHQQILGSSAPDSRSSTARCRRGCAAPPAPASRPAPRPVRCRRPQRPADGRAGRQAAPASFAGAPTPAGAPRTPRRAGRDRGGRTPPRTGGRTGTRVLVEHDASAGAARHLVAGGGDAAASRVVHGVHLGAAVQQRRDQGPERCAVRAQRLAAELVPAGHDRGAVLADRTGDQHRVAGRHPVVAQVRAGRHHAHAGGDHEGAVGLAPRHDLGVPGDDLHPGLAAARAAPATNVRSSSTSRPSSRITAHDSHSGRAPATARSLTVPHTERYPRSPPGKTDGSTTKASVVKASRPGGSSGSSAASESAARAGLSNAGTKSSRISSWVSRPPPPWASRIRDAVARGPGPAGGAVSHGWRSESVTLVAIPGGAAALVRDHARPDRCGRGADGPEQRALRRVNDPLQHVAAPAAAGLPGVAHLDLEERRVAVGEGLSQLEARVGDQAEAPPHRVGRREEALHHRPGSEVAVGRDDPGVEVLHLGTALDRLPDQLGRPAARRSGRTRPPPPSPRQLRETNSKAARRR